MRAQTRLFKALKSGVSTGWVPQDAVGEVALTPPSEVAAIAPPGPALRPAPVARVHDTTPRRVAGGRGCAGGLRLPARHRGRGALPLVGVVEGCRYVRDAWVLVWSVSQARLAAFREEQRAEYETRGTPPVRLQPAVCRPRR